MVIPKGKYFDIVVPMIPSGESPLLEITVKSKPSHKRAVYTLARFFQREFDYDFVQYDQDEQDPKHVAFL